MRGMTSVDRLCKRDATEFGVLRPHKNENKRPPIYLRRNVGAPKTLLLVSEMGENETIYQFL